MRRPIPLSVLPLLTLFACSDPKPPTVCGSLPQVTVHVGEREVVEPCFEDPEGGAITLSVAIADEEIVAAGLVGARLSVTGKAPGTTTVVVTATDPDSLQATQDLSVLVPNRAPEFTSSMRDATVRLNGSIEWNLTELFTEPDGEDMTFSASSSNTSAVTVAVNGSTAVVSGRSEGQSQVTLTAADPHGLEGTGTIDVTVRAPVTVFEDDFATDASLDDWSAPDTASKVWVEDGALHVQALEDGRYGIAERETDGVRDFELELTAMIPPDGQAGVIWITGEQSGDQAYRFLLFPNGGWLFSRFSSGAWNDAADGTSSDIEPAVFQNYTLSFGDGNIRVSLNNRRFVDETITGSTPTMDVLWLIGTEEISEYDYAKLSGFFDESRTVKRREIMLPRLDRKKISSEASMRDDLLNETVTSLQQQQFSYGNTANASDCYFFYEEFSDDTTVVHRRIVDSLEARVYENPKFYVTQDKSVQIVDFQVPQDDTAWADQYVDLENDRLLPHCPDLADSDDTLVIVRNPDGGQPPPPWALNASTGRLRFALDTLLWHPYEGQRVVSFARPDAFGRSPAEARLEICVVGPDDDDDATCVINIPLIVNVFDGDPVGLDPEAKCRFIVRSRSLFGGVKVSTIEEYTGEVFKHNHIPLPGQPDKQIVRLNYPVGKFVLGRSAEDNLVKWACRRGWSPELELVSVNLPQWAQGKFSLEIHRDYSEPVVAFVGSVGMAYRVNPANLELRLDHPSRPEYLGSINSAPLAVVRRCYRGRIPPGVAPICFIRPRG